MKKMYEKPVLTTERFDPQTVISASSEPVPNPHLNTTNTHWESPHMRLN